VYDDPSFATDVEQDYMLERNKIGGDEADTEEA
jgi:small subunit ribosomal protein S24e